MVSSICIFSSRNSKAWLPYDRFDRPQDVGRSGGSYGNIRVGDSGDRSDCIPRIAQVLSQTIRAIGAIKGFLMETIPDDRSDRGDLNITHSCRERHDSCHNVLKMAVDNEFSLELFTADVQIYGCLYKKFSKEYNDKYKGIINCWKKIGGKFGLFPEGSEKQYKNIRTAYGRFLKRTSPSKSRKNDKKNCAASTKRLLIAGIFKLAPNNAK